MTHKTLSMFTTSNLSKSKTSNLPDKINAYYTDLTSKLFGDYKILCANSNLSIDDRIDEVLEKIEMETEIRSQLSKIDGELKVLKHQKQEIIQKINNLEDEKTKLKNKLNLHAATLNKRDWSKETFDFTEKVQNVLENSFKMKKFRSQQMGAINALLNKKNVLLLMPTGGGKSLCYQLPAVVTKGVTIVVSPLVALMEDQMYQLKRLNIKVISMSSNTTNEEKKQVFDYLNHNKGERICLIYVTPEWLAKSKRFMSALQKAYASKKLDRFAIDEVHCVSTWGHDFRTDYTYLSLLKNMFPDIPIIGLTATATTNVLVDVQNVLDIPDCVIIKAPFDRPNLKYRVIRKMEKTEECLSYLVNLINTKFTSQTGIIYTATIKDCTELAKSLRKLGLSVRPYHAEMDKDSRKIVHESWINNETKIIVGTIAFGMGIDKPDVRFVIHYTLPKSMESLYQESGRAGRDGQKANCIVLYKLNDYLKQSAYSSSKEQIKNCLAMLEYCLNITECRHKLIGAHFEEVLFRRDKCDKMCDNCIGKNTIETYNVAKIAEILLKIIDKQTTLENNLTLKKLMDIFMKNKDYKHGLNVEQTENIIGFLIIKGYIREERNYTAYSINTYLKASGKPVEDSIVISMVKKSNLDSYFSIVKETKRKINVIDSDSDDCSLVEDSLSLKKVKLDCY